MHYMKEILNKNGYKATPARLAILKILSESTVPLNAETIYKKINAKGINEATVYRTLLSFEESGIVTKVDLRKKSAYFEIADEHHHHIVCTNCNTIEDFKNTGLEAALEKIIKKSSKFKNITEHSIELFGVCKTCI